MHADASEYYSSYQTAYFDKVVAAVDLAQFPPDADGDDSGDNTGTGADKAGGAKGAGSGGNKP